MGREFATPACLPCSLFLCTGQANIPVHFNQRNLIVEIQRGYYAFVFDAPNGDPIDDSKGTVYIDGLDSEHFLSFKERFEKRYTGSYFVRFFNVAYYSDRARIINESRKHILEELPNKPTKQTNRSAPLRSGFAFTNLGLPNPPLLEEKICGKSDILLFETRHVPVFPPDLESGKHLSKEQEVKLKLLLKDSLTVSADIAEPLKIVIDVAKEIREVTGCRCDNTFSVFQEHQNKAASSATSVVIDGRFPEVIEEPIEMYSVAKMHTSEPYEAAIVEIDPDVRKSLHNDITAPLIEKLDEVVAAVYNNTRNQERATFNGSFRAFARFKEPEDEVAIEKIHRLRCDDVEWNYIGRVIYHEEEGKEIPEADLPGFVNALQQRYKRAYPDPAKK